MQITKIASCTVTIVATMNKRFTAEISKVKVFAATVYFFSFVDKHVELLFESNSTPEKISSDLDFQ